MDTGLNTKFEFRLTKKELADLKEMARVRGYTVSEYIREKLFGRRVVVRWNDRDTLFEKQNKKGGK